MRTLLRNSGTSQELFHAYLFLDNRGPIYIVILVYGFMGGIIAGLLTIPISEYGTGWAIKPVLGMITKSRSGFDNARSAGLKIPLKLKFVIIVVVMVVGIAGFTSIISYSLFDAGIRNMSRIEALLPPEASSRPPPRKMLKVSVKKISGKTNILSLNAGIEAIKAGESGKRFGKVAEEVRLLGQGYASSSRSLSAMRLISAR